MSEPRAGLRELPVVADPAIAVAFGHSRDLFERLLRRMVGGEDGVVDALFRFTRPLSSASFWCPPLRAGRLDLRAVGL